MALLKVNKEYVFLKVLCNLVRISLPLCVFSTLTLAYFGTDYLHVLYSRVISQKSIGDSYQS